MSFQANPGAGGDVFAADEDINREKYPLSKIAFGDENTFNRVSATDPLPTALSASQIAALAPLAEQPIAGANAAYWPSYQVPQSGGNTGASVDTGGALVTRGAVLTDEGTFRANFANTSLAVAIGTCTVSGKIVTGTGFNVSDVHLKDYFKFDADAESAWLQIESIDSATQITLVADYVGATSGAASRALLLPITGAGGAITVASGQCTITSGTTSGSVSAIIRAVDYAPAIYRARHSISQRIANQSTRIGFAETTTGAPRWFARFRFEGTVNTVAVCETGRNPTGAPSVSETESTTITLPNGLTSAALLDYRVEMLVESVRFYVAGILVAEHIRVMPSAFDLVSTGGLIQNTGVPSSTTSLVTDYVTAKNHNKLEIGVMSDAEKIVAAATPLISYPYNVAGVIPINTDLLVFDCSQLRSIYIQCASMGTTGNVTPQWCNEPTFAAPITATLMSESGATATTFNAAVFRFTNVIARYFRLRLTTATTVGTTTINAWGSQDPITPIVTTQPVSGTVTAAVTGGTTLPVTPTTTFVNSAATTNALAIKASAGTIWSVVASNTNAATRFLKLHNIATLPVPGTTPVALTVAIPSGGTVTLNGGSNGIRFGTGIGQSITANAIDSDTTAVAVGDVKVAWSFT